VPLTVGPAATLGPEVKVTLPRPRDRKAVNHDVHFKEVRGRVIEYLLGPGRRRPAAAARPALASSAVALEASA
jgi:nitrate/nitrite transport system ATP-binding protein